MRHLFANLTQYGGAMRAVDKRAMTTHFMRHVLIWLITARYFIETEQEVIESTFGPASEQVGRFVAATHAAYDAHAGYQFTYKLRDFAQHGGTPLSGVRLSTATNGETEVVPFIDRAGLLGASFNWTRKVRRLIEAADDVIPLIPMIDDAMIGLSDIETVVLQIHLELSAKDRDTIAGANARVGGMPGNRAVFQMPPAGADGTTTFSTLPAAESMDSVVHLATTGSPLEREDVRVEYHALLTAPQRGAARRASAAIAALTTADLREHERIVQQILADDQSAVPLISGITDVARMLLLMLSTALGTTPELLLGALTPKDGQAISSAILAPE